MPKFAANLTMMYTEVPFLERFAAAARAGFKGIEFLFPYAFEAAQIAEALDRNGLSLVLHNLPTGNWEGGERGIACHPDRFGEFRDGVGKAITYASALRCPRVNCLAGLLPQDGNGDKARDTLVDNLSYAAAALREAGIALVLKPVNTRDVPGFFVNKTRQALAMMDDVASDNLKLRFDIDHTQVMEVT